MHSELLCANVANEMHDINSRTSDRSCCWWSWSWIMPPLPNCSFICDISNGLSVYTLLHANIVTLLVLKSGYAQSAKSILTECFHSIRWYLNEYFLHLNHICINAFFYSSGCFSCAHCNHHDLTNLDLMVLWPLNLSHIPGIQTLSNEVNVTGLQLAVVSMVVRLLMMHWCHYC